MSLYIIESADGFRLFENEKEVAFEAKLSVDDVGHEHKEKGQGGGQFTSKEGGGGTDLSKKHDKAKSESVQRVNTVCNKIKKYLPGDIFDELTDLFLLFLSRGGH